MPHTTAVQPGLGTTLQLFIATDPNDYVSIAQVESIDGPSAEVGSAETSNLASTIKTFRPTIGDSGEVSFTIQYDPQDPLHILLLGMSQTPALEQWQLIFADDGGPTSYTFDGFLTGFKPGGMATEENLTADVTLKLSGAITQVNPTP